MVDPSIRGEIEVALRTRRQGVTAYATALVDRFDLAVTTDRAAAIVLALTMPEVHAELVDANAWSEDAYEAWLAGALQRELLEA